MAGQIQGGANVDLFDSYFRRADLDQDGRISGAEAVSFFQGSNLPKNVLAQIWMHADQNRTGFLGRAEFYNALKLVTVAQSKRELTPDIVKAAIYGPASAKIPAPQINLASIPSPQMNAVASSSPQTGPVAPMATQTLGFRGQVPPNSNMNQQYYPSQGNHAARPPLPVAGGTAPLPPHGVSGSNIPRGGTMVGPGFSSSNTTSDWIGGRSGGPPSGATSQGPTRGISQLMTPAASKPPDVLSASSFTAAKDSKSLVGSGNGLASDPMFGGDVFSATPSLPKHNSSVPTYSASGTPASSAIVPVSTVNQSSVKLDPLDSLQSTFMRQPTGVQLQPTQSQLKTNQQVPPQNTSSGGISFEVGNSMSNQSQLPWPKMTPAGVQKYAKVFLEVDSDRDGKITGEQARNLFLSWRLPREVLKQVWDLSDQDNDSMLSLREFCIALYLMERFREGRPLPSTLPSNIVLDETLMSLTGQPNASYGNTAWGPTAGLRPQHGMTGPHTMTHATGLRPPGSPNFTQVDGTMQFNQQKASMPLMVNSQATRHGNGEQSSLTPKFQEAAEPGMKVEDKSKVILDSKEKIEFYRTKMQDLVLYKSRCDNRLNEITERAIADKREAELLAKKYEEKYKQVAEIASKLTIEEATFRDIQERKTELNQAIVKMEQGGSADGILQVRADRIQSDLDELMRAVNERCKKHGIHVKSTALIELPVGWQPGVPELSAVWDEDWDKFEDAGFSFDVTLPSKTKTASVQKDHSSSNDSLSPTDGKSENLFNKGGPDDLTYSHSEDESAKSPGGSPVTHSAFESASQEYSNNHFRKNSEADSETHRSFDEPAWGTFDNNDDIDSVWGFNSNARESDHEKHGEKYFFGSSDFGASPTRTESPQGDSIFQKKSPFTFEDSVPGSPLSRAGNSPPRYGMGSVDTFFDNSSRFDSFSVNDHGFSPRRETLTRFDSINSTRGFDHSHGFSSFDDSDPFGSTGPFKVSSESQTPKRSSDNWNAF